VNLRPEQGKHKNRAFRAAGIGMTVLLAFLSGTPSRAADLEFGLPPYISTRTLMGMFKPLARFIELRLSKSVMLVTAPSVNDFDQRLLAGEYDVAIASPHIARLLDRDDTYNPLLRFTADLYGLLLVRADSPLTSARDLTGKPIAFPQASTSTYLLGKELLERHGVKMTELIKPVPFQDSVLMGLLRGEYAAALVNPFALMRATAAERAQVREIAQTRKITHLMLVARSSLTRHDRDALQSAIAEFMERTPEGSKFLRETGLGGVRPPSEAEMRNLDTLAAEQKKLWEERPSTSKSLR